MKRSLLLFIRSVKNNPKLFIINLLGFSLGITSVLFIYLYSFKELSTDRYHQKHADIYRVLENDNGSNMKRSNNFYPLGKLLQTNFREVYGYSRYMERPCEISTDAGNFGSIDRCFVDSTFFNLFDFDLSMGTYSQLFKIPNGVIITQKLAQRFFNKEYPIGKEIDLKEPGGESSKPFVVVGILSDYPEESTLQPQIIANIETEEIKAVGAEWNVMGPQLFLYMPDCNNTKQIASQISGLIANENSWHTENKDEFELQPFDEFYLHSTNVNDNLKKGDANIAKILLIIGVILMLITSLNYVILNLGLSYKSKKYKNIHIILGGSTTSILINTIRNSIIFSTVAFITILFLYPASYKIITNFTAYNYSIFTKSNIIIFVTFYIVLLLFGIISGLMQSLFIIKYTGHEIISANILRRQRFFNGLIQLQLVVFIIALTSLILINRQVNFIRNTDLGFDAKNTFTLSFMEDADRELFLQEFSSQSYINDVSKGQPLYRNSYNYDEVTIDSESKVEAQVIQGDHNYLKVYDIKLLAGENLDHNKIPKSKDDFYSQNLRQNRTSITEVIVNQEFVKQSGLKEPIGSIINNHKTGNARIIGIIDNVRNLPVYYSTKPLIIGYNFNTYANGLIVSVQDGSTSRFISDVNDFYDKLNLGSYSDLLIWKYDFEKEYRSEQALKKLINVFSSVILIIMILGLVGLSIFITETKVKEIGIRKVNGAKVAEILALLNSDFVKWVIIAFIVATPIVYYAMNKWLETFAYKTELSWWVFALSGLLALGIALLTVSFQSWRAATRNPVEALRYE